MSTYEIYCPYCGTTSQVTEPICSNCGASLDLQESIISTSDDDRNSIQPTQGIDYRGRGERVKLESRWLAISSLILGIISVSFFLIPIWELFIQIGTGLLAIAAGIFGIIKSYKRIQSIFGLILGFIGSGLWIYSFISGVLSIWEFF